MLCRQKPEKPETRDRPMNTGGIIDIRSEFPVTKQYAYMDVANKCAPPMVVADSLAKFISDQAHTGGDKPLWFRNVARVKSLFADLINASADEVALVKNTSEGFNLIANSMVYEPGDNVVTTDLEHPNNMFPWLRLKRFGVEVRVVKSHDGLVTPEDLAKHVDSRTRLVSVTAVGCVTGARLDIAKMADVCHANGAPIMVDGVQSLGMLEFDVRKLNIDFLASGAYKGLLSPHGLAFLYCKSEIIKNLIPPVASRANVKVDQTAHKVSHLDVDFRDDAGRFEIGNYCYGGATAGCVALEFLLKTGVPCIERHILHHSRLLADGLIQAGLTPMGPVDDKHRSGIVSVAVPDAHEVCDRLAERGVICTPREGCVRFSLHGYNNEDDISRALDGLKHALRV